MTVVRSCSGPPAESELRSSSRPSTDQQQTRECSQLSPPTPRRLFDPVAKVQPGMIRADRGSSRRCRHWRFRGTLEVEALVTEHDRAQSDGGPWVRQTSRTTWIAAIDARRNRGDHGLTNAPLVSSAWSGSTRADAASDEASRPGLCIHDVGRRQDRPFAMTQSSRVKIRPAFGSARRIPGVRCRRVPSPIGEHPRTGASTGDRPSCASRGPPGRVQPSRRDGLNTHGFVPVIT